MMRDELLQRISALPPETEIDIQVGGDHLDITDLVPWGDCGFVALRCHSNDLHDVLLEWGIPRQRQDRILLGDEVE